MNMAILTLQLIRCGRIGFGNADEINPEYINGNCPPIAVLQSQAYETVLFPILVDYYQMRRPR